MSNDSFLLVINCGSSSIKCEGQAYLGISLDPNSNRTGAKTVPTPGTDVNLQVMESDEERMIAQQVQRLMTAQETPIEGRD